MMRCKPQGFSLLELMVAISLIVVLMHQGVSWHRAWQQSQLAQRWIGQTQQQLELIRQRAFYSQSPWVVCRSPDQTSCADFADGLTWLVFEDANGDAQAQPAERKTVSLPEPPESWRLVWRSFRAEPLLRWSGQGDAPLSNGTLTLCPAWPQANAIRQLVVSKSGRMRLRIPWQDSASVLASAQALCE